jgi:fructokinase
VVDTVGAGDAFTSGLLAWLDQHGALSDEALRALDDAQVAAALTYARHVAAVTCTRAGSDPPHASELAGSGS